MYKRQTNNWLKRYEIWQRNKKLAENTIGIRFRTLRVVYNLAIEKKIVNSEDYPFRSYKVSKLHQETAKRSITKEEIHRIINYEISSKKFYKRLALDLFTFSYLMGGINFMDMALLTSDNIIDNRLVYFRKKTDVYKRQVSGNPKHTLRCSRDKGTKIMKNQRENIFSP